jgi:hypothetical protein
MRKVIIILLLILSLSGCTDNSPTNPGSGKPVENVTAVSGLTKSGSKGAKEDIAVDTSDWKLYENKKYKYSLMYPPASEIVSGEYATNPDVAFLVSFSIFDVSFDEKYGYSSHWEGFDIEVQIPELIPEEYSKYINFDLKDFAHKIWESNKNDKKNKQIGDLTEVVVDGKKAYQFTLTESFSSIGEYLYTITNDGTYNYIIKSTSSSPYLKKVLESFHFMQRR